MGLPPPPLTSVLGMTGSVLLSRHPSADGATSSSSSQNSRCRNSSRCGGDGGRARAGQSCRLRDLVPAPLCCLLQH